MGVDARAVAWIEAAATARIRARVPELLYAEVANALTLLVRARSLPTRDARTALAFTVALPFERVPLHQLAEPALDAALAFGLTAYDACYAALAEAADAPLVTADRRLADAVARATLLADSAPP